jgi:hypothetical protein
VFLKQRDLGGRSNARKPFQGDLQSEPYDKVMHDEVDVNLEQFKTGYAWWYRYYAKTQPEADRVSYEAAEDSANADQLGLLADPKPINPYDWRKGETLIMWSIPVLERVCAVNGQSSPPKIQCGHSEEDRINAVGPLRRHRLDSLIEFKNALISLLLLFRNRR